MKIKNTSKITQVLFQPIRIEFPPDEVVEVEDEIGKELIKQCFVEVKDRKVKNL